MTHEATTYRLVEGRGLPVRHHGELLRLAAGTRVERRNDGQELPLAA